MRTHGVAAPPACVTRHAAGATNTTDGVSPAVFGAAPVFAAETLAGVIKRHEL